MLIFETYWERRSKGFPIQTIIVGGVSSDGETNNNHIVYHDDTPPIRTRPQAISLPSLDAKSPKSDRDDKNFGIPRGRERELGMTLSDVSCDGARASQGTCSSFRPFTKIFKSLSLPRQQIPLIGPMCSLFPLFFFLFLLPLMLLHRGSQSNSNPDSYLGMKHHPPELFYEKAKQNRDRIWPPKDFRHFTPKQRPRDLLRREVRIATLLAPYGLKKESVKRIERQVGGKDLRHLMRQFRMRPKLLMRRRRESWTFDAVFKENVELKLRRFERTNETLIRSLKKLLKNEFHNFVSKDVW